MPAWTYDGLAYRRRPTRTVTIGDVAVGSAHPIRVQSMTTPPTRDTAATVGQIERLVGAGCEIVRLTVPTSGDADNLPAIRAELRRRRVRVPLVADIHFTPAAAMRAVEHVEKVRINPGNYADKKRFAAREYSDREYAAELERIETVFAPLVERARQLGVAMRIGTNHGSLSDRIMNRYGDTPEGMVESALEFVRICERRGYRDLILSMKASNPVVVLHVYRLLAQRMAEAGMDYPFHLGVTEAGDGEDARVKSAIGIGGLLDEGLGDTVRVSLTEDPVREIPVARALVEPYNRRAPREEPPVHEVRETRDPFAYARRPGRTVACGPLRVGAGERVAVEVALEAGLGDEDGAAIRREVDAHAGVRVPEDTRADLVSVDVVRAGELEPLERLRDALELVAPRVALSARVEAGWLREKDARRRWLRAAHRLQVVAGPGLDAADRALFDGLLEEAAVLGRAILVECVGTPEEAARVGVAIAGLAGPDRPLVLTLPPHRDTSPLHAMRRLAAGLDAAELDPALLLLDRPPAREADPLLAPASALGSLLCDGLGDAIRVEGLPSQDARRLAFGILQAARVRITRTEFISCPSCGRTLFDLEETTARIKARTAHLKGVKIAVMGCIVNGPGEMADADFGYVGWGENKIALFVGKEMVAKDVPTERADDRLVELIKERGMWVDPPVPA